MQNLVHAWLIRVERLTADIDRKRAHLEELRGVTLGLQALEQEKERLLDESSRYLNDLSVERAQLSNKVMSGRKRRKQINDRILPDASAMKDSPAKTTEFDAERMCHAIDKEDAQMHAFTDLINEESARAERAERNMQQELEQVMAQTKQTEEAGVDIVAAVRRATAETAVQAQECEDLEQRLAQTKEKIGILEQEIACMQMHAAKRAQQKSKAEAETHTEDLVKTQRSRDAASTRLNHIRRSNADLERHLKSVDRQILNAQRAVQQLVA